MNHETANLRPIAPTSPRRSLRIFVLLVFGLQGKLVDKNRDEIEAWSPKTRKEVMKKEKDEKAMNQMALILLARSLNWTLKNIGNAHLKD